MAQRLRPKVTIKINQRACPMRILDIDLDFFLDKVALNRSSQSPRLSDDDFHPWAQADVRLFLEERCGLSTARRIPGRFVTHHDEAFYYWRDLLLSRQVVMPFAVVHIDAHADLGDQTFRTDASYVPARFLHLSLPARADPPRGTIGINAGNYLLYAIACRWLDDLYYVTHPSNRDLADCGDWMFSEKGKQPWILSLPKYPWSEFLFPGASRRVLEREPPVTFRFAGPEQFTCNAPFDFMVLCHSPAYTPSASDLLIPLIREYMIED